MALYLAQHGRSLPKEQDPERGLSPEGIAEVERIAGVARGYGVRVGCIRHSGKLRALRTAEIFAAALLPERGIEESRGLDPLDPVEPWPTRLRTEENLMLVGHLPFLERLTGLLIVDSPDRLLFKFQNGGLVCLDRLPENPHWFIKWALMPRIG
jgi:phosphohistidine phosphatase